MDSGRKKILVVEDDPAGGRLLKAVFGAQAEVLLAENGAEALRLANEAPDAVLLDLGLPDMDGMQVLEQVKKAHPTLPVIVLTGDTEVSSAVKAIQLGAFNYFTKPIDAQQVLTATQRAMENRALQDELRDLKGRWRAPGSLAPLMGPSRAIAELEGKVRQVAGSGFTVLVHGETGTGKELVARAIHDFSPRAAQPFVALDCGAIPDALLESELFGYEKGAFSGAERRKEGYFQVAQGGTLFLDEIANLSLPLQAKLLRVLQERQLQPLGGTRPVSLDVRFVAASNHDLEKEFQSGRFRQDLYYRLAEVRVDLPPLRQRPEDIPYLAQRFMEETAVELRRPVRQLDPEALAALRVRPWPGNVRELRNLIRQAVLQCEGLSLGPADLRMAPFHPAEEPDGKAAGHAFPGMGLKQVAQAAISQSEQRAIRQSLAASGGNILRAARALGIDNKTMHAKLKKYHIRAKDFHA